jgi:ATP-dependent protease ClpP protease subunit
MKAIIIICLLALVYAQNEFPVTIDPEAAGEAILTDTPTGHSTTHIPNLENVIRLTEDNFVALRGKIDEESSSAFISDLYRLKADTIYVYLITPGGSIVSGNNIIQALDTLVLTGKTVICIADHAYSMGFVILQSCQTRYILPHSIIMQHQASLTVQGPIEQARNHFKLVEKIDRKSNIRQSKRMGLTTEAFHEMAEHDLWLYADEIIEVNAADKIVNVICDFDVNLPVHVQKNTMFGTVFLEFSLCPLIHVPRKISFNIDRDKVIDGIESEYSMNINNVY